MSFQKWSGTRATSRAPAAAYCVRSSRLCGAAVPGICNAHLIDAWGARTRNYKHTPITTLPSGRKTIHMDSKRANYLSPYLFTAMQCTHLPHLSGWGSGETERCCTRHLNYSKTVSFFRGDWCELYEYCHYSAPHQAQSAASMKNLDC